MSFIAWYKFHDAVEEARYQLAWYRYMAIKEVQECL